MKLAAFVFTFVQLALATNFQPCKRYNEFCIDIKHCPDYKQNASEWSQNWPEIKPCNREEVDGQTIISVCCKSPMNHRHCGIQGGNRIYEGQVAKPFTYPWMALLQNVNGSWVCGGTLISSRYVLTAAHCVQKPQEIVSVRLGENDFNEEIDCTTLDELKNCAPPPQDIRVDKPIQHPEYNMILRRNDIALLKLASPAVLSGYSVRTICLPDGTPEQRNLTPWTYIVSGWGVTDSDYGGFSNVLRYAQIPAVPLEECAPRVRKEFRHVKLNENHICAGGVDGVDACRGDSGGPLHYVRNDTSRYVQQGVVAFGMGHCGVDAPGVYTNVGRYIGWLVQNVDD